jgi:hypothetical protein
VVKVPSRQVEYETVEDWLKWVKLKLKTN